MTMKKTYIISLGGSLIFPKKGIDWKFLKKFKKIIEAEIKKNKRFIIITGGGNVCRVYQQAANKIAKLTNEDKDWLGVHSTRLNAHLLKTIFRKQAHPRINKNPLTKENLNKHFSHGENIMVAAGWRPGWSTDYVAVILAERFKIKTLINLSNIDYVYDKNPKKYKDAEPQPEISWPDFKKIVGSKWTPGLNTPFDPIAARKSQQLGLKIIIMNGQKINNLKNYLAEKKFKGTVIK